jgi:peptidoglycan/xylan/chitin deacetylase (PgdA/CDA1 family)
VLVFLVAGYAGRENLWDLSLGRRRFTHLSWGQIVEMSRHGANFGSHGITHADLTGVDPKELENEVAGSRRMIEDRTGQKVRSFSYPFGRYDSLVAGAVEDAGYEGAFSLYPRHANEHIDKYALRRNGVYVIDTNRTLEWKIERGPLFWFEEMKCRAINSVAVLTPLLKKFPRGRGN